MEECRNMSVKGMQDALKRADAKWAREILRFSGDRLASIEERRLREIEEARENVLGKGK